MDLTISRTNSFCTVVEGCDLAAKDSNGLSDPYMKVTCGKITLKTKVIPKTLNPKWEEFFFLCVQVWRVIGVPVSSTDFTNSEPNADTLSLEVWDKDRMGSDFMGRNEVRLADLTGEKVRAAAG